MSERDPEGRPDDVRNLLRQGRAVDPVPAPRSRRLWARIERSLSTTGGGGGVPGASSPSRLGLVHWVVGGITASALAALIALLLMDRDDAAIAREPEPVPIEISRDLPLPAMDPIAIESSVEPPLTSLATDEQAPVDTQGPPREERTSARVAAPPVAPVEEPEQTFERERELLELANAALQRGDLAAADRALLGHRRSFPRGMLSEERDALAIGVLLARGQTDAARARATRFVSRYPQSIHRERVEPALR
jgi:hypothetical protein